MAYFASNSFLLDCSRWLFVCLAKLEFHYHPQAMFDIEKVTVAIIFGTLLFRSFKVFTSHSFISHNQIAGLPPCCCCCCWPKIIVTHSRCCTSMIIFESNIIQFSWKQNQLLPSMMVDGRGRRVEKVNTIICRCFHTTLGEYKFSHQKKLANASMYSPLSMG